MPKPNIEALGKVNFSVDGGLKIGEIEHIENIEHSQPLYEEGYTDELNKVFNYLRLTRKQKELLESNFLSLKETYLLRGKKVFNLQDKNINGLGRATGKVLLASFENQH